MTQRTWLAAIFLATLNAAMCWRILLPGVIPYRESIERGYAYFGKLFAANPDYLSWNPLQYCGIPMHYTYLPLLPYVDALLLWIMPGADATSVHRAVCGVALFLTPAAFFLFARETGGRSKPAFWAALALTFLSPLYLLIGAIRTDRGFMDVPWRVQTLIKYGEGPHTAGLLLMLVALIAVHRTARTPGAGWQIAAAVGLAATVLTNWVAGLALAFCVLMLLAVHFPDPEFRVKRVLLAGLIGYGLAAFWLTPSFVFQMFFNWPKDAFDYQLAGKERIALATWVTLLILIRLVFWRFSKNTYLCWITLCLVTFGLPVTLFYSSGINIFPEARRYALEYEMFLLLVYVEAARILLSQPRRRWRYTGVFLVYTSLLVITPRTASFLTNRVDKWVLTPKENTPEYRSAAALQDLKPTGRVHVSGGTRFRLNSWFPIEQTGGVFETGLRTRVTQDLAYQIRTDLSFSEGLEAEESIVLMRALGVEYVVVHGAESKEYYRDYKNPAKFEGRLEKVWSQDGDSIYRLPSFRIAHLVKSGELPAHTVTLRDYRPWAKYVAAQLDPQRPALQFRWIDARHARVDGQLPKDFQVAFAVPWDPNWRASSGGRPVAVKASPVGLMVTESMPVDSAGLDLTFEPSLEERACAGLSIATALGCMISWFRRRR
ncbi:MAG: hypothetical protein FJW30_18120 [Acidobacteria bacterium]|nr:hypothetical protein [Acidobacteriota bacterium]